MTWVRLDDHFPKSPAAYQAGPLACWFHICALAWCARSADENSRLDGFIPADRLAEILPGKSACKLIELAEQLTEAGVWTGIDRDYLINDYAPPVALHPVRVMWNAMRQQVAPIVFHRDGYRCVSCGARKPLTVDHQVAIHNGGTNDLDNLRTLCRPCNSRKGTR